jgi:LacI family transcriptional regulator, galactose operon repressor
MARQSRQPSITSVAAAVGVSPTTVSHALSGKRAVSKQTRDQIMAEIERQKYRPNLVARSLRSRRTQSVALLVADIANPYYPAVARALHDGLAAEDYVSFIGNTDGDAEAERTLLAEMVARGVDGIVVQPMGLSAAQVRRVVGPAMPLVVVAGEARRMPADQVCTDDAHGIAEAVDFLAAKGMDRLGFIGGPEDAPPGPLRLAAFRAAIGDAGLRVPDAWVEHTPFTRDGGAAAAARLFARRSRPRAVLCANDLIAIGVMDAARRAGLRVPEDLAVVGFDDIETADLVTPRLTTVVNPAAAVGDACARTLLSRLRRGPGPPYEKVVLPTRLVVRESA